MVFNACHTLGISDPIEMKPEMTGDCQETWVVDSFSVMVLMSLQNMIWTFPKRLLCLTKSLFHLRN